MSAERLSDLRTLPALQQSQALRYIWPPPLRVPDLSDEHKASIDAVILVLRHINSFLPSEQRNSESLRVAEAANAFLAYSWLYFPSHEPDVWQAWRSACDAAAKDLSAAVRNMPISFRAIMEGDLMISTFWARPYFVLNDPAKLIKVDDEHGWTLDVEEIDAAAAKESLVTWDGSNADTLEDYISGEFGEFSDAGEEAEEGETDASTMILRCYFPTVLRVEYKVAAAGGAGFRDLRSLSIRSPQLDVVVDEDGTKTVVRGQERSERYNLVAVVRLGSEAGAAFGAADAVRLYDQLSRPVLDGFPDELRSQARYTDDLWRLGDEGQYMLFYVLTNLAPLDDQPEVRSLQPEAKELLALVDDFFAQPDVAFDRDWQSAQDVGRGPLNADPAQRPAPGAAAASGSQRNSKRPSNYAEHQVRKRHQPDRSRRP